MNHIRLGALGEFLAAKYLKEHDYIILAKNYRIKRIEVDIVALKDDTLIIVEVKTRRTQSFGRPSEAVNRIKQQRLKVAGTLIWQELNNRFKVNSKLSNIMCIQFDVIEVREINGLFKINHLENSF